MRRVRPHDDASEHTLRAGRPRSQGRPTRENVSRTTERSRSGKSRAFRFHPPRNPLRPHRIGTSAVFRVIAPGRSRSLDAGRVSFVDRSRDSLVRARSPPAPSPPRKRARRYPGIPGRSPRDDRGDCASSSSRRKNDAHVATSQPRAVRPRRPRRARISTQIASAKSEAWEPHATPGKRATGERTILIATPAVPFDNPGRRSWPHPLLPARCAAHF
jgi:hypothetical protein